ncbi:MAG: putative sulfate exporter family transporter [Pseudomonadota bacterium]
MADRSISLPSAESLWTRTRQLAPGVAMAVIVAMCAQFLAEHYATPAMLLALLLGIALGFLGEEGRTVPGVAFAGKSLLRLGVALLGVRISAQMMVGLGIELIALVIFAVIATIGFGLLVGRVFGFRWKFSLLTAGSVAICGASAAMAISAILPKDERSEERLIFTVMGVTVLSTIAMVVYPILVGLQGFGTFEAGIFIGASIHDVAQVVGAGYTISEEAGDVATLVKLFRVAMLAPVVLVASLLIRRYVAVEAGATRPPLLPGFVIGFLVLATLSSVGALPQAFIDTMSSASRWLLLTAIAAVGMKSNIKQILSLGGAAVALIVAETIFIACVVFGGLHLLT